jgi:hypothetical protein
VQPAARAANCKRSVTRRGRYDQDESGARDVSEEMDSFNMKGRGDDATLTERQVKRLSARQVRPAAAVRGHTAAAAGAGRCSCFSRRRSKTRTT